jgi:hypothetical protein
MRPPSSRSALRFRAGASGTERTLPDFGVVSAAAKTLTPTALIYWAFPEPTRGLEPPDPLSLRVSRDDLRLAFSSHIPAHEVRSDDLTFVEFGTNFGTRCAAPEKGGRDARSDGKQEPAKGQTRRLSLVQGGHLERAVADCRFA